MNNYLEKLLNGADVEWKALGEVTEFSRGLTYNKSNESDTGYKVLRANNISLSTNSLDLNDIKVVSFETKVKDTQKLYANDILISIASGSREHVGKVAFIVEDLDYYFGGFMGVIRCKAEIQPRFLFHILTSHIFNTYLDEMLNTSTINNLSGKVVLSFQIPIPPLSVQKEIVRILDLYSKMWYELANELANELALRLSQYNYYRDKLLTFGDEVEWKCLGDVVEQTYNIKWADNNKSYQYIDLTSVSRENNNIVETTEINALNAPSRAKKLVEKDDVIFATTRPTQQRLCLINDIYSGQVASTGYCVLRAKSNEVLPKWIFYYLSATQYKHYVEENQRGSAYPAISDTKVKEFKIPVPSLAKQQQIVDILDSFDKLTNSITEGLPKEIDLRQKQYEYYRDLLLDFSTED